MDTSCDNPKLDRDPRVSFWEACPWPELAHGFGQELAVGAMVVIASEPGGNAGRMAENLARTLAAGTGMPLHVHVGRQAHVDDVVREIQGWCYATGQPSIVLVNRRDLVGELDAPSHRLVDLARYSKALVVVSDGVTQVRGKTVAQDEYLEWNASAILIAEDVDGLVQTRLDKTRNTNRTGMTVTVQVPS